MICFKHENSKDMKDTNELENEKARMGLMIVDPGDSNETVVTRNPKGRANIGKIAGNSRNVAAS